MADEAARPATRAKCPICGRATEPSLRPFCSKRCRDRDLLSWLAGHYVVPAVETEEDGAEDDQEG